MDRKIKLEIVTTTKIQATIGDKKQTVRLWRLPVIIPEPIKNHLKTYFDDAEKEVLCSLRTDEEWVDYIKSFPSMSIGARAWVTAVIWWHFGKGNFNKLFEYYKSFSTVKLLKDGKQFLKQLDEMGISKVANDLAADREYERDIKLKKIIRFYEGDKDGSF